MLGSGSDRLVQPRLDVLFAGFADDVTLAVRALACFGRARDHLAVAGETGEGGIDLAEGEGLFPTEVGVVVTLEVIPVTRLPVEQPEQSQRHAHRRTIRSAHTLSQYGAGTTARRPGPAGGTTTPVTPEGTEANPGAVVVRQVGGSGVDLAVTELGELGPPTVLLVHGFPDTSAVWAPVAQLLATAGLHVVAYDVRGAGNSGVPDKQSDYALAVLIEDMAAVITAVSPDSPVHLVGHDWGSIQGWEAVTSELLAGRIASFTSISGPPLDSRRAVGAAAPHPTAVRPTPGDAPGRAFVVHRALPSPAAPGARHHRPAIPASACRRPAVGGDCPPPNRRTGRRLGDDFVHGLELYRANVRQRLRHPTARFTETPVQIIVPMADRYVTPPLLDGLEKWSALVWRRESDAGHWIIRTHPDQVGERGCARSSPLSKRVRRQMTWPVAGCAIRRG